MACQQARPSATVPLAPAPRMQTSTRGQATVHRRDDGRAFDHRRIATNTIKRGNMKQLRLLAVAAIAICALSAAVAANANAAAHITYSGSGHFTISSGSGELVTAVGTEIFCTGDVGSGQLGPNPALTALLTVSFVGCETAGLPCTSAGQKSGLIDTTQLVATLGDINKTTVGALLKPETGTAFLLPSKCGTAAFEVKGSVIGELASTQNDKQKTSLVVSFTQSAGSQTIKKFEGEATENNLEANLGKGFEKAGLKSTETLTLESGGGQLLP